uniref:Uncharacterized protein n=1 Tax=Anopheles dirus TaxID=7168 RepID=A0A182NW57_9DIPT
MFGSRSDAAQIFPTERSSWKTFCFRSPFFSWLELLSNFVDLTGSCVHYSPSEAQQLLGT